MSQASAGQLVLAGDASLGNAINGSNIGVTNPDNADWFTNILGAGTRAKIQNETGIASVTNSALAINTHLNSLAGVTSTLFFDPDITAGALSGVDLFIDLLPDDAYSASEVAVLGDFLSGGGTLFIAGDSTIAAAPNNGHINALMAALGSSMTLSTNDLLTSANITDLALSGAGTTTNLTADPLNAGIASLTLAGAGSLNPGADGTVLVFGVSNINPVVAYQNIGVIPVPAAAWLFGSGLLGLARVASRRGTCRR